MDGAYKLAVLFDNMPHADFCRAVGEPADQLCQKAVHVMMGQTLFVLENCQDDGLQKKLHALYAEIRTTKGDDQTALDRTLLSLYLDLAHALAEKNNDDLAGAMVACKQTIFVARGGSLEAALAFRRMEAARLCEAVCRVLSTPQRIDLWALRLRVEGTRMSSLVKHNSRFMQETMDSVQALGSPWLACFYAEFMVCVVGKAVFPFLV
tara:strand:- start:1456 stop:2079 length:624 start_codon:yes stop_codon:yes gene_type:complete